MAPVMMSHRVAITAIIKYVPPIAGIIKPIIPAATKADIGKPIAIIAGIIIIERIIRITAIAASITAGITTVNITVAIISVGNSNAQPAIHAAAKA
jgi:hypothetical protein